MVVTCLVCVLLCWFVFVLYLDMDFFLSVAKLVFMLFVLSAEGGH